MKELIAFSSWCLVVLVAGSAAAGGSLWEGIVVALVATAALVWYLRQ